MRFFLCIYRNKPQDLKYKGESNSIIIGDNNILREYVNINPGTKVWHNNTIRK